MALPKALRDLFAPVSPVYNVTFEYNAQPIADIVAGMDTANLYRTQPNLRAVVTFLADSIAQLPVRTYRREADDRRTSATGSTLALLMENPNPDQTSSEFMRATMVEYLLYGEATWWIVRSADAPSGFELRIIPSTWIRSRSWATAYAPDALVVAAAGPGGTVTIPREQFTQFREWTPGNPAGRSSAITSLKSTLAEQVEAERFRRELWKSQGRFNAYISRPKDVTWTPEQRADFVTSFREAWNAGGEHAGKMPLLEDGMEIKATPFNAKEAQWVESVQLARQDCAAAWHLNPACLWHDQAQTYASAKDNARALYSDTLGPYIRTIEQRVSHDLGPKIGEDPATYIELDLTEKLRGSFEEQVSILQSATGAPFMTRDESRARLNLPPVDGGDQLIVPLNVIEGGLASATDTDPTVERYNAREPVRVKARADDREKSSLAQAFGAFFERCGKSVLARIGADADWWDAERWERELADDIRPLFFDIADRHGLEAAERMGAEYVKERTGAYLARVSDARASQVVRSLKGKLDDALAYEGPEEDRPATATPAGVFEVEADSGAERLGTSLATAVAGWAVLEAARQASRQGRPGITKTWVHNPSASPRPDHEAMDGETVPYSQPFSNGAEWPGDDALDIADVVNCGCTVEVTVP